VIVTDLILFRAAFGGMKMQRHPKLNPGIRGTSRRDFLFTAAAVPSFSIIPRHVLGGKGFVPPSELLNVAGIGVGGMGFGDLNNLHATGQVRIVALCDVDEARAAEAFGQWPDACRFRDFRIMLEKQKDIEAVVVATPDHCHAPATMAAMRLGKHVYCEKPLTHSVYEARRIAEAARETGVVTQLGNQGHASEGMRLTCEWIWDGAVGEVPLVEVWTNAGGGGGPRPLETPPAPETLDWDRWLGPAPYRPYHPSYHPFRWRRWWDFGTGPLGDMASHLIDIPYWALKLGYPSSVEAESTPVDRENAPTASTITYIFPARGDMPAVKMIWYDGGRKPVRPPELEPDRPMGQRYGGVFFHGTKGTLMVGCYGDSPRLIPETRMQAYRRPQRTIPRSPGHHQEFVDACKGGAPTVSNFEYAGPLTEIILLGNVAVRTQRKIEFHPSELRVSNDPEANQLLRREYREGWKL
jgi:predicted dehydrogenase